MFPLLLFFIRQFVVRWKRTLVKFNQNRLKAMSSCYPSMSALSTLPAIIRISTSVGI